MHRAFLYIVSTLFGLWISHAIAEPAYIHFPSDVDWKTRSSEHFDAVYRAGQSHLAERVLAAAERARKLLAPIFPQGPERAYVVIADFHDSTNGYALTFPYPHMVIFAVPPASAGTLANLDDWLTSLVLHEYVHILHLYPANGLYKWMRTIFGSWVVPNGLMPTHLHEGVAVLMETEMSRGGRGRSSFFQMYKRMAVKEGAWGTSEFSSLDRMDGTVALWPEGIAPYFFGYTLYEELWKRKGAPGIYRLTEEYSDNWPYFTNSPLETVYGLSYSELWSEIFKKTEKVQRAAIEAIEKENLNAQTFLTQDRFDKWDLTLSPDGKFAAFRRWNPEDGYAIETIELATGKRERLHAASGSGEGLCWSEDATLLFIGPWGEDGYSLNTLAAYDLRKKQARRVVVQGGFQRHLHRLACDRPLKTVLAYHETGGEGHVLELRREKSSEEAPLTFAVARKWMVPEGTQASSLLVGTPHTIALRTRTQTHLYRWAESASPKEATKWEAHVFSLRTSGNADSVLAISNTSGRDEIWELGLLAPQGRKLVALLGGAHSFDVSNGEIFLTSYRHGGFDIAKTAKNPRGWQKISLTASTAQELPQPTLSPESSYTAWRTILPRAWVPSVLFVPTGIQFGAWIPGFDLSQRHSYNIIGGYDTRGLPFALLDYTYRFGGHHSITSSTFFLPSFIQSSRDFFKRWGATVAFGSRLPFFPIQYQLGVIFKRMESVGVIVGKQSVGASLGLSYSFGGRQRPLSISPVAGTVVSASHAQYLTELGSTDNYFTSTLGIEQYLEAPWAREHVFYGTVRMGYTEGTSLYNSFFEAGGELLFYQGRGAYLNRGFLPGIFLGRRLVNGSFEYRFPIANIERGLGLLPFRVRNIHAALVTDVTTRDFGPLSSVSTEWFDSFYFSSGIELKTDWIFSYYLPGSFRLGFYHGWGPYGEPLYVTAGIEASL